MSLSNVAQVLESNLNGKDINFVGCSTDSRTIERGNLFVALKGEHFDGHEYISQVEEKGASSLIIENESASSLPYIKVNNTRKALGLLAGAWREEINVPLIAITGSNGKTTVKEMVTSILSVDAEVHSTRGNYNNDIGVPLTLFDLDKKHKYAVIEMGANHPGEIEWLSSIARPNVAVITQCAPAHLEGFGSIEGVAKAKAEIYSGLIESGIAVINLDDDYAGFWQNVCRDKKQLSFGINSSNADVRAESIKENIHQASIEFDLIYQSESLKINLPLSGRHNVMNALAATACCLGIDIPLAMIKTGLEMMQAVKGRLQLKTGLQGSRVIDDTYNANPTSLNAALDVLKNYHGNRFLILGDMGELGDSSIELHKEAGLTAKQAGINGIFTIGDLSSHSSSEFGQGASHFDSYEELNHALLNIINEETTFLVKGSRTMKMEKVVEVLTGEQN